MLHKLLISNMMYHFIIFCQSTLQIYCPVHAVFHADRLKGRLVALQLVGRLALEAHVAVDAAQPQRRSIGQHGLEVLGRVDRVGLSKQMARGTDRDPLAGLEAAQGQPRAAGRIRQSESAPVGSANKQKYRIILLTQECKKTGKRENEMSRG